MDIKMVDLHRQYQEIKADIDGAIQHVINTTAFIKGPEVNQFENELANYLNVKHVIACANGTDALQLALMALDLKPGDEVITPNFTFISTVEVVALMGLKPVLVDVNAETFTINPSEIKKAITPKTKAIIPVHLFGQCANMDEIKQIANEFNLFIVEDSAQALGTSYTFANGKPLKAGTIGDIGTTSFFPSKNLGCYGDGGALFTNNDMLAERIRILGNHGMKEKYNYDRIGLNSRLDTLQAAILLQKLPHLDAYNKARQKVASYYNEHLKHLAEHLVTPTIQSQSDHIYHQYTLKIKNGKRDALKEHLNTCKIPSMIYYPYPLHNQPAFATYNSGSLIYKITEQLCTEVLSLPVHTHMTMDELQYITENISHFYHE